MAAIAIEEARATLRIRGLVHTVLTGIESDSRLQIGKLLEEHGSALTPEEESQGSWRQLLICLRTGLFGRCYDQRAIAYLVRRDEESIEATMARLDEAFSWKVKSLIDQRLALQRRELYARLAADMKLVATRT